MSANVMDVLRRCQRLFDEALPKFNYGASFLDGNAIALLNEVPAEVKAALDWEGKERHTETERLDWVLQHADASFDKDPGSGKHWIVFWYWGSHHLAEGRTHRECIDNAIDGIHKSLD